MVSSVTEHQPGEQILFTAPLSINQDDFIKVKTSTQQNIGSTGSVAFEALERVVDAPLKNSSYNKIYSNTFSPSVSVHSPDMISCYLRILAAGGHLALDEPVLLQDLSNTVSPISRKEQDLVSMLKLAGFINIQSTCAPVSDDQLVKFFQLWGGNASRVEQGVNRLSGKFGVVHILAQKPNYEVGQKIKLNFGNKNKKPSVWTINTNDDDDDDMEDDEALLDEEDKIKPSKASLIRPDDCEMDGAGRRKACKNCVCGRAEAENAGVVSLDLTDDIMDDEVIEVDPTPKKVGGCGSCALGDAFRCSTCPYLGMPAFNEGEKVSLGGMFGQDDI
ncbi:cytokine-induced anti-apoptosis inhibitor 1, Fe-S biogenesis-domain-containing protein [Halteromyces radiatus]|uniref:cytokine-induced anti-apoptosis inhibitor 1, Fe-S biogenesis-domain-containing protein n=1 Tax=Halteromyces radiatus TaxID=101107 RepID=UPI002221074B|nr:cytokine-induced anti-apoptosis inhibitor 1, Fe-S biogenesis-domain-containing protein [Halteromyces radiatus]KAI8096550.1 cytokine-induced anti-apoptosis inhibitor 1, Fe-S biogenesis-domain-containing protein [Halteromyces radiatus]